MAQTQPSSGTSQRRGPEAGRGEEQHRQQARMQGEPSGGAERGGSQPSIINMTAIAARGMGQVYDMQLAATRMLFQTQARAAAAFGIPDYSDLFRVGDDRAKRVFASGTEQLFSATQRASDTMRQIQHHIGRLIESNTVTVSESWRHGLEEFATQAEEGLEQLQELARQQADEALRAAESLGEAVRETIRQGGEEIRETMRQGAERGREAAAETSEALRAEGERVAGQVRGEEPEAERGAGRGRAA